MILQKKINSFGTLMKTIYMAEELINIFLIANLIG